MTDRQAASLDRADAGGKPSSFDLTRRSLLQGGGVCAAAAALGASASAAAPARVPYGMAVLAADFDADPAFQALIEAECDLMMPSYELKIEPLRPTRETFAFEVPDRLVDWAGARGMGGYGFLFVWHISNPPWLERIRDRAELEAVLVDHIERTADHYRGRLLGWHVVNEAIAEDPRGPDGPMRDTFFRRVLGPDHIATAFRAARRADPAARLIVNDYNLEFEGPRFDARRAVMLDLVRSIQDAGERVDAVGLQAHLHSNLRIDREALARFGRDLRALGVGMVVSELDVIDVAVEGDTDAMDEAARVVVADFLDGLFAGQRPESVVTWGLTDRYSWINGTYERPDGRPARPLPFDRDLRPKPWYAALRHKLALG